MAGCDRPSSQTGSWGDEGTRRRKDPMSRRSVVFYGSMVAGLRASATTSRLIRIELYCVRCDSASVTSIRVGRLAYCD